MTWTYNVSQLATNALYQVRFVVGDTLTSDQQLQDEEISFALTQRPTVYGAAAECCRALATKFARSVDSAAGETKNAFSQLSKAYAAKAQDFEAKAATSGSGLPYAGGISVIDKQGQEQDTDRVQPQFNIGMDENLLPVGPANNEDSGDASTSGAT